MKLAVRRTYLGDRVCVAGIAGDRLVDLRAAHAYQLSRCGQDRADAIVRAERELPQDLPGLLAADPSLGIARRVAEQAEADAARGDLPAEILWSAEPGALAPPVGRPRTVWGMTGNYPRTRPAPGEPPPPARSMTGFLKAAGSLTGPHDEVIYPAVTSVVHPEVELGVVIGSRARRLTEESAMDAVAGYVIVNDLGSRDIGETDNRNTGRAKGFDTYTVLGPWFVTADEIPDPHALAIRFWVNGELRQDGSTAEMYHRIPEQLAWLTTALTLFPGDVVSTGTPPGVRAVVPGDKLRGEIEGLGAIENAVVPE
ncbi:fumarylacetoacetate hydrolase family protein [Nocardia jiangxiensis]|uniref:Fumarylacetoacetate hydrolase family protein n=1 Tax=Nocardia jiangxiensis TaxID=282685 RepID=A0ABW6SFF1_9NOCA|nr:fumarylacetoacetate hydrolase family protein [Nocardia jiangxiensis]